LRQCCLNQKAYRIVKTFGDIHDYFLSKPRRVVRWGFCMSLIGMFLLSCGLVGELLMIVTPSGAKGGIKPPLRNLDTLLPYFPTWWIPESWFGYFAAAMIAITGLIVCGAGRRMAALLPK
jgi:hypothetical protein